jgi:GH24 family phage-related lysozyme (muramidase)
MMEALSPSEAGLAFIAAHEGFCSTVYRDTAGCETIGYGHCLVAGEHFDRGIGEDEARRLLAADASRAADAVRRAVRVALSQAEFDALVSFTFNVGAGAFAGSTLLATLNKGDFAAAADQILRWDKIHVDGVLTVSAGLAQRREDERRLFRDGDYGAAGPVIA